MSILSELKKLTGKNSAKVVSEALPDSLSGDRFMCTFEDTHTVSGYRCDKTFAEVVAAYAAGKEIWANIPFGVFVFHSPLFCMIDVNNHYHAVTFKVSAAMGESQVTDGTLTLYSDESVAMTYSGSVE